MHGDVTHLGESKKWRSRHWLNLASAMSCLPEVLPLHPHAHAGAGFQMLENR